MGKHAQKFILEERRLQGDLGASFQCFRGALRKDGERLLVKESRDGMRGDDLKLN